MFSTLIVLFIVGYGLKKAAGYAKDHPDQSMEAMRRLRQMLGR